MVKTAKEIYKLTLESRQELIEKIWEDIGNSIYDAAIRGNFFTSKTLKNDKAITDIIKNRLEENNYIVEDKIISEEKIVRIISWENKDNKFDNNEDNDEG